jgi:glycosyltransferase involved in cell wall biosynthesis
VGQGAAFVRIVFVGVKRKYQELPEDYRETFTKTHLELPWYYAKHGPIDVAVTTVDYGTSDSKDSFFFMEGVPGNKWGSLEHVTESLFLKDGRKYDVVVHWRKWFPEFYRPEAINVINCQDHSFTHEWQAAASQAFNEGKLHGILCFPTWHKKNLLRECLWLLEERAFDGLTLGVDTDIYQPSSEKDPYQMLWASDPGRGLSVAVRVAIQLFQTDRRFRLNVCYPDYCQNVQRVNHPAIVWHGNVSNGPKLWDLFNKCGVLPYTSNFMEPSSRAHRQAQAAGSLVLYPPGMGTPSELIQNAPGWQQGQLVGVVSDPSTWPATIERLVKNDKWKEVGNNARALAISENWAVQADRFRKHFERVLEERR